ncbi:hypothetical protein FRC04_007272 [Tulasnella sp. 424]|nr:hypothetical protein FRC04_007272 [Tulasnella sp. 424]
MSTVHRLRNVFANMFVFLFVFILSAAVLLPIGNDVGFMELKNIWSTFFYSSLPSPFLSSSTSIVLDSGYLYHGNRTTLDNFKVPAYIALLILTLLAYCTYAPSTSIGLQKATADSRKATADVKQEQAMSKFHREMVEAACRKYVELKTASAEALRRSNNELDESKQNVNTLVGHLRQHLESSAKEHKQDVEAAERNRLKAIAIARYAQAEANVLRSEAVSARSELDAMRVEIDLVRRDLGASKRRARAARNEAGASHTENASLRSALVESRKEVSTVRKGAETLMAELKAQKANNKKLDCLLAAYKRGVLITASPPLTPPGSVTPPEGVKAYGDSSDPGDMPESRLEPDQTQSAAAVDAAGSTSTAAPGLDLTEGRAPLPSTCSYMIP